MEPTETAHLNENYLPIAGNDVAPDRLDCPLNHQSSHASARQARNNAKERKRSHGRIAFFLRVISVFHGLKSLLL
jgi:hypothetical protein